MPCSPHAKGALRAAKRTLQAAHREAGKDALDLLETGISANREWLTGSEAAFDKAERHLELVREQIRDGKRE
jgi:hypothetical protein